MPNDVTRRDAFKVLATGAVIGAASSADAAVEQRGAERAALVPPARSRATFEAARRMAGELAIPESNPACMATVMHCRSWTRQVYLHISERVRGFVTLSPEGFALAAACQAAGRPVAVRYWGYEPWFSDNAGRFEGAVLALDPRDLPGESASSI